MSNISFSEEHEALRATIRAFLAAKSDETAVREQMATERGYDPSVWAQLAAELGLVGLIIPEEHGGAGFGYVELLIAMEEMGSALLCAPYLSSAVLAANTLMHCAEESEQKDLLPGIASGELTASVAYVEPGRGFDPSSIAITAGTDRLSGEKAFVLDGHTADVLLVVARTDEGLGVFRVDADASGLSRQLVPTLDITRKLAHLSFSDTPARRISRGDQRRPFERVLARTVAALTAEQVGGANRCLEMATEYAKTRLQFGRPIGSYQAIKHKCADMLVAVELAKSAAYAACFAAAQDEDCLETAALAKAYCSETYFRAAADTIQ
ncbi:MAG: acyl-CoA dehydrogenase, partial [Myxococcales bacterium]|nr:acyl-CoA dehydrogenase [Myxococcales bacterium]